MQIIRDGGAQRLGIVGSTRGWSNRAPLWRRHTQLMVSWERFIGHSKRCAAVGDVIQEKQTTSAVNSV